MQSQHIFSGFKLLRRVRHKYVGERLLGLILGDPPMLSQQPYHHKTPYNVKLSGSLIDIHNHRRLRMLSQEAEISGPEDTFGNRVNISSEASTYGQIIFQRAASNFWVAAVSVREYVVFAVVPDLAFSGCRGADLQCI